MDTILDIFNSDAFSALALTDNVNVVPNMYGRLNELGIFSNEPIPTTHVAITINNGVLNLLPTRQRGAPPTFGTPEKRHLKSFIVPHIPHDDSVLTSDVQDMFAWTQGLTQRTMETVLGFVNRKLVNIRRKHAITLENLRMGAIKGIVTDADGSLIYNWYNEFQAVQYSQDFQFGTPGPSAGVPFNIGGVVRTISGYMEDNLMGDTMTGVHALCSPQFFARLISHPSVVAAYQFYASAAGAMADPNRNDVRRGFMFQGVMFEEYRGYATYLNEDKTTTKTYFINPGEAIFFPMGTTETFANYWAPPDFISEANEMPSIDSQVFVAPLEPMKFGKGMEMHTESNPLPICKRPALLVRGFSSN